MSKKSKPIKLIGKSKVKIGLDGDCSITDPKQYILVIEGLTKSQAIATKDELVKRYNNYRP